VKSGCNGATGATFLLPLEMYGEYGKNETKTCAAGKGYTQFSKSTRGL
jgi:hypothetical protein